jgi:hypothetical protein
MTDLVLAVVALAATVTILVPPMAWPRREKRSDPLSRRAMHHLLDDEPPTDEERRGGPP